MGIFGIAKRGFGLLGKKGKTISSVKPKVKYTGTKSLIDKYKKTVAKIKTTDDVMDRKVKAAKSIHGFVKKHGGTKSDEIAGAAVKGKK